MERRRTEPPGLKPGDPVAELARLLEQHRGRAVALTGAGVSVASGIPAFRGRDGLWSRFDPEEFAHIDAFRRDPERVWSMLDELYDALAEARPNRAHQALARLEEMGCLRAVITQNIDGLHQAAGSRNVIELHGNFRRVVCMDCGSRYAAESVRRLAGLPGGGGHRCWCGGWLKPDIVFFGEELPQYAFLQAWAEVQNAGLLLVVGTSAEVEPAASLPRWARKAGAVLAEVNPHPALDAEVVVAAPAEQALPAVVHRLEAEGGAAACGEPVVVPGSAGRPGDGPPSSPREP
ncbi:SIR2 family NAD-dependent protein deacylase [Thermaerobacter subterraneus]|uniref:protein acetyllysine N-acetyltransferase n=1 Tax=Thermaerobacter subterraneus DSM 13965 TaxID=867903 RepID=K6QEP2_9FIRM|nr:NAD-dependent deacylase [Thermaerobacter subterraneus]EKP95346.1 NAD-dependent protein deacetylase, SIR2 family [Thermaerobacter subterraneus DSM 13965]